MHISEGVLSPAILSGGMVLTATAVAYSLRRIDYERLTTTAVLAAFFFVGSLVHVPLGPGNVHLVLNGLLGLFLGWAVFPALLVALLLQAILFQYGGLAVLGVNTFNMALPALLCALAFRPLLVRPGKLRMVGAFACGSCAVAGAALLTALSLALTDEGFWLSARLLFLAHVPVMLLEGLMTMLIVGYLARVRPELLPSGMVEARI